MKQVRKAIIPAAGLGTRFLPATKALAKEMLPIVDKPTIQFIVEEARKSGIQDIVVVDGKNKRSIEDHFDSNPELEDNLRDKHKDEMLKLVQETTDINIYFIRQSHPRGPGPRQGCDGHRGFRSGQAPSRPPHRRNPQVRRPHPARH